MSEPQSTSSEAAWHTVSIEEAGKRLGTNLQQGLNWEEVRRRLQQYGPNQLEAAQGRSALAIFFDQFKSLIVVLLAIATGVALAMGDRLEAFSILAVIFLNALIGFFTEARAEQAIAALKKQAAPTAQVIRDGHETQIPSQEVVPGDVIVLGAGGRVPADGRIVESVRLQLQEAALTGESQAINKACDPLPDAALALGDRTNMAYMATAVTDGRGRILVTGTGSNTEMGHIGKLIEGAKTEDTPLEKKLEQLGRALIVIVLGLCVVIAVAGLLRGHGWLQMFKVAISLAIAAVPEGLPAVSTVTLAIGVQRMAKRHALIRRLAAVETLGSTTVICVDKTGTLTRNEMTVAAYELGGRHLEVTGSGYGVEGEFREGERKIEPRSDHALELALRIGALCNDAKLERVEKEPLVLGDPTEAALIVAAEKAGHRIDELQREHPRLQEIPFSSEAQRMVTVHRAPGDKVLAFVKGSPGAILERSSSQLRGQEVVPLTAEDRERFLENNRALAHAALRVLALAYRELPDGPADPATLERDLIFVGFAGMIDPLREEAKDAIAQCRAAGMRVLMLTGDQPATAEEIARQLGLDQDAAGKPLKTLHARELEKVDPEEWSGLVAQAGAFARVTPEHKLRIIEALQKKKEIVAMTGDGVNDAPALKKADIGIAMGIKGTEVAKETSDMIITDDNFASIVGAVEQGRIIYRNIQRFIHYLFSCNLSEILTVFVAILIGWPLPLVALQILWLNLITDVFPALALALEGAAPGVMKRPPRDPNEKILHWRFNRLILWQGMLLAAATLTAFGFGLHWHGRENLRSAGTMAFMTLALAQIFHAFNTRSEVDSIFNRRLFSNPWLWSATAICLALQAAALFVPLLRDVLQTAIPSTTDWLVIGACSFAPILVVELVKVAQRRFDPRLRTPGGGGRAAPSRRASAALREGS